MQTTLSGSHNKPIIVSLALISLSAIFWIAVISEQIFHQGFLMEHFVLSIDRTSPFLSILFFIIFPFIAFVVNLFYVAQLKFLKESDMWITMLGIRPVGVHLAIILFSLLNILILLAYSITENFIIIAR